jgi:hypothetical protein
VVSSRYWKLISKNAYCSFRDYITVSDRLSLGWGYGASLKGCLGCETPGPLAVSAMALFGPFSVFDIAASASNSTYPSPLYQICQQGGLLLKLGMHARPEHLGNCRAINTTEKDVPWGTTRMMLSQWIHNFETPRTAESTLSSVIFVASDVILTEATIPGEPSESRQIWSSPPLVLSRPHKSLAATIIISTLLAAQLLAFTYVVWYIYRVPTWTHSFDSISIVSMVSAIEEMQHLPSLGLVKPKDLKTLEDFSCLVEFVMPVENDNPPVERDTTGSGSKTAPPALVHRVRLQELSQQVVRGRRSTTTERRKS